MSVTEEGIFNIFISLSRNAPSPIVFRILWVSKVTEFIFFLLYDKSEISFILFFIVKLYNISFDIVLNRLSLIIWLVPLLSKSPLYKVYGNIKVCILS